MKRIKIKLTGLLICFCYLTVFGQTGESKYVLRVTIEGAPAKKIYYGILNDRMTIIRQDSIRPKNGQFVLRGKGPLSTAGSRKPGFLPKTGARVIPTFNCYLLKTDTVEKERRPSYSSLLGQDSDNGRISFENRQTTVKEISC